ncbi:MAG: hypothetical protein IT232_01980 [Flavobacteriales bacterium]|nr:hypothetical protein [Flavobacteriales bacterium]
MFNSVRSTPFWKKRGFSLICCISVAFLLLQSCATQLEANKNSTIKRYTFGEGGGFTGDYIEYSFSEDGKVYKRDFNNQRDVFFKNLNPEDTKNFITKINELGILTMEIKEPGNISKYIEIREGETSLNKIVWGSNSYHAPDNIVELHKKIFRKLAELD